MADTSKYLQKYPIIWGVSFDIPKNWELDGCVSQCADTTPFVFLNGEKASNLGFLYSQTNPDG